ncbi:hypothetical protein Sjap_025488 [Stephania japonica]|uniref:Uncharacterized protein n=1 Tax=Stephania japonica TaxID=461633 RepID=A0AAP0HHL2_9MAGN
MNTTAIYLRLTSSTFSTKKPKYLQAELDPADSKGTLVEGEGVEATHDTDGGNVVAFEEVSQVNVGGDAKSVEEDDRGESTMPSRFRYLTEEAPDRPLRWPWLVALGFLIYAWRTVLWELSNWTKAVQAIAKFMGYLFKLALAFVFHYIGDPITNLIRFIETSCYTIQDTYASIVASIPFGELTVIILLTSAVLAIAETLAPESVRSQPYPLAFAGVVGFAAARDLIPELFFWALLAGLFCFSFFFKKRDYVQSSLPVAAALTAVGNPFVRFTAMASYITLAISRHSQSQLPQEKLDGNEAAAKSVGVPFPLVAAAAAIAIHVAAKWIQYR